MSQMRFEPEQERYVDSVCMLALACMRTCLYIFMFIGSVCMCASVSVPRLCACVYAAPVSSTSMSVFACVGASASVSWEKTKRSRLRVYTLIRTDTQMNASM